MWWSELDNLARLLGSIQTRIDPQARVDPSAILKGAVQVGAGTRICAGAYIEGPVAIGSDCLIGNGSMIRGATWIGARSRVGFATEVKASFVANDVAIGPQCYVGDSRIDSFAYLGAQVRTSNQRLDRKTINVLVDGNLIDTGRSKLGCHIGSRASLGIQVIVLPGRVVAPDSLLEPRITVTRNLPSGKYRVSQTIENY